MSPAATANKVIRAMTVLLRLPFAEQRAMLRLVVLGAVIEMLLRVWPLPRVARLLGVAFARAGAPWQSAAPLALSEHEHSQLRCVRRIARHWRFCTGTCLRESLLAGHVLRRHQPRLVIGVTRDESAFAAHAWLDVRGHVVGDPGRFQHLG